MNFPRSRATSMLIVKCIKNAGSDDGVRISFSEEPSFKLLTGGRECLRRRYLLRLSDRVFQIRGPSTDCWTSDRYGTIRRLVPPERNVRRPGRSATGTSGRRYRGTLPCITFIHSFIHSFIHTKWILASNAAKQHNILHTYIQHL